jgi:sulfide dehydrogenase [flavocytochrome c] flavoprotein subunit
VWSKPRARVIVIGGGFGGATCAKYLRQADPTLEVTLVTPTHQFITCPFSNVALVGLRDLKSLTYTYDKLRQRYGVRIVYAAATALDPTSRSVTLSNGATLTYDRLVLAPGAEINGSVGVRCRRKQKFSACVGSWLQTTLFRQLEAMPKEGRCHYGAGKSLSLSAGAYERASLIAQYLKMYKPKSKVLLLDSKIPSPNSRCFWRHGSNAIPVCSNGSQDHKAAVWSKLIPTLTVHTEFDKYKPNVANIIPHSVLPQSLGPSGLMTVKVGAQSRPVRLHRLSMPTFISSATQRLPTHAQICV